MDPEPTSAELTARVATALSPEDGVVAAYLFGSRAQERARSDSDIDVAVLLDHVPPAEQRATVVRRLVQALGQELAASLVDVVLLNDAPPVLAFKVLQHGKLALCQDAAALHRFTVATYRRHSDREPTERLFREVTKRRAQREASRG
jgi:hypothetical protein